MHAFLIKVHVFFPKMHAYETHMKCIQNAYKGHTKGIQNAYKMHTKCIQNAYKIHTRCIQNTHQMLDKLFQYRRNNLLFDENNRSHLGTKVCLTQLHRIHG